MAWHDSESSALTWLTVAVLVVGSILYHVGKWLYQLIAHVAP